MLLPAPAGAAKAQSPRRAASHTSGGAFRPMKARARGRGHRRARQALPLAETRDVLAPRFGSR
jgi:hypothetical protein